MNARRWTAAAAILVAGLAWAQNPPAFVPSSVPAAQRGIRGFVAVRGGQIVATENAQRLFVPASVLKLIVCTTALHHLGPSYRLPTVLAIAGTLQNGVLNGDLVVEGSADPTWNRR